MLVTIVKMRIGGLIIPFRGVLKNRRVDMATPLACGQGEETMVAKGTGSLLAREAYFAP